MKLSLRWVCDHLSVPWHTIDVKKLVEYFNIHVAEIEVYTPVSLPTDKLFMGIATKNMHDGHVVVEIPELANTAALATRDDLVVGATYLIIKDGKHMRWAAHTDLHGAKDNLLPALTVAQQHATGEWKKTVESDDVILEVDNKSITHRPDLWSHRGFAREIARFVKITVTDEKKLLIKLPEVAHEASYKATKEMPVSVAIETQACSRFAVLPLPHITNKPTSLFMALRLARVDSRVINAVVDATNYVMFDWGQPLHAFDAEKISTHTLIPRQAKKGETLTLLDGTVLHLDPQDMVVTDGKKPLALAGVKGGLDSGVSESTKSLLVESATFDAGVVRTGAARHNLRTEASARFEKSLDPHQNVAGIERFLKVLAQEDVTYTHAPSIVSLGVCSERKVIVLKQSFIEARLGIPFKENAIKTMLESIGFTVQQKAAGDDTQLTVTVPTYRATKDIKIPEDIVEEVGRLHGYSLLQSTLPVFAKAPTDDQWLDRMQSIKNMLAYTAHMHEVATYSFADQEFAKKIGWVIKNPVMLRNPIAEHRTTMLDDLVPSLLQVVDTNKADNEQIRLFEWARTWSKHKDTAQEQHVLAGLVYQRKDAVDYYQVKQILTDMGALLGCTFVYKPAQKPAWWANEHMAADVYLHGTCIGTLAALSAVVMARLDGGHAVAFSLDTQALEAVVRPVVRYTPLAKFQGTFLDTSALFKPGILVHDLQEKLKKADPRITHVYLWDMFSKPEWHGKRSLTFRCFVQDAQSNMTKEDTDQIVHAINRTIQTCGGEIR